MFAYGWHYIIIFKLLSDWFHEMISLIEKKLEFCNGGAILVHLFGHWLFDNPIWKVSFFYILFYSLINGTQVDSNMFNQDSFTVDNIDDWNF